ncbi:MAG: bacteriohemerythrin [Lachnospiraceae bacterium]|nr:bacteriohemerythrin [Lachnospiraceae bacterium]
MNEIKWNDRFNIGVDGIDKAHQRLFSIVGKLLNLNEDRNKQQHACREGIKYFKNYTLKHFAEEEAYMQSINYSEYGIHKSLHDNMCNNTLPALERELESQNYSVESVQHFLGICVGWLNGHIMIEDHAITGRTPNKWVHEPSEDEMVSLEKAIIQTLETLFRVKAEIVSLHYSGEDFSSGNALCYRLTYSVTEGKPIQAYLVYEDQMVLSMLNDILGKQIKRVDKTVTYAIKMLSQKFMDCLAAHFTLTNSYQLEKIDLMTFDQIARVLALEKQYPPYSLLFSTEKNGYFAFFVKC